MNHHNHRESSIEYPVSSIQNRVLRIENPESSIEQRIMQNKPNFPKSQVDVTPIIIMNYEEKSNWTLGENKPNSKPIKPNFRKAKMNVNSLITKDYRKKDDFAVQKNKPNSNPISVKPKMSANSLLTKDYENETARFANRPYH